MRSTSVLVTLALVAVPLMAAMPSNAVAPESCKPGVAFQSDDVRIWFAGHKGFFKVFDTNGSEDEGPTHFDYQMGGVSEFTDDNAALATMSLDEAFPQTSTCEIVETEEFVNMTISITDDVRDGGHRIGTATVDFVYHFNKSSNGAKFDLFVEDWPWQGEETELAYDFRVHAANGELSEAENGIGYSDENGNPRGYIEWAPNATAIYEDEHEETAIVDSETANDGQNAHVNLRFTNVTAGYTLLEYDPWMGSGFWIIVGPLLVGLAPVEDLLPAGVLSSLRALL